MRKGGTLIIAYLLIQFIIVIIKSCRNKYNSKLYFATDRTQNIKYRVVVLNVYCTKQKLNKLPFKLKLSQRILIYWNYLLFGNKILKNKK